MEGYKTLKAGQLVSFDTVQGPKGLHAANIQSLPEQPQEKVDDAEEQAAALPIEEEAIIAETDAALSQSVCDAR